MNNSKRMLIGLIFASLFLKSSWGYELATHSRITQSAFSKSELGVNNYLSDELGITEQNADIPVGNQYYEMITNTAIGKRDSARFITENNDLSYFPNDVNDLSIQGWLMRGAIREDDYVNDDSSFPCRTENAPNPQDEGPLNRPLSHFYDPVYDRGLTGFKKSFDWGLGTDNALADQNGEDTTRINNYTLFDAREAMYRAVTMQTGGGSANVAPGDNNSARPPQDAAEGEQVRNAYWATTFRILGDLTHLIQDVAQPQHTRNDPHPLRAMESEARARSPR